MDQGFSTYGPCVNYLGRDFIRKCRAYRIGEEDKLYKVSFISFINLEFPERNGTILEILRYLIYGI